MTSFRSASSRHENVRHSPGGRFVYSQFHDCIVALDTMCGQRFNMEFEEGTKDMCYFEPVSEQEAVVFR
jgi:hypothetical protein